MSVFKIVNRDPTDYVNQQIIQVFREMEDFDVDLIVSKKEIVSAHRVILSMYSPRMRSLLSRSDPEPKFAVSLKKFSNIVIRSVVDLLYYGEIRVLTSIKGQLIKALIFLRIDYEMPFGSKAKIPIPVQKKQLASNPSIAANVKKAPPQPKSNPNEPVAKKQKIDHVGPFLNATAPARSTDICLVPSNNVQPAKTLDTELTTESPNEPSLTQENLETMEIAQTTESAVKTTVVDDLANEDPAHETSNDIEMDADNIIAKPKSHYIDEAAERLQDSINALMKDFDDDMEKMEDIVPESDDDAEI